MQIRTLILAFCEMFKYDTDLILKSILDVNECEGETNPCDKNARCNNTVGGYTCTCNNGYSGNGEDCEGKGLIITHCIFPNMGEKS